jgi:hypothetical protein
MPQSTAPPLSLLVLLLPWSLTVIAGCSWQGQVRGPADGACADGTSNCAAAQAPAGMRQVRRGHRMVNAEWMERSNLESGGADIGLNAQWAPVTEQR